MVAAASPTADTPPAVPAPTFESVYSACGRDAIALALWWSRRYAGIVGFLVDPDEVMQAGRLGLWKAVRRCRNWDTFPGFWKHIVKQSVYHLYERRLQRSEGRRFVRLDQHAADGTTRGSSLPDHRHPDPADAAADREVVLPRLLAGLTAAQAEAVGLVYGEGLDQFEVADRLGISRQAVHIRLNLAFAELRDSPLARELHDARC